MTLTGEHFVVVLSVALTMLAAVFVLQQRRTPQSTAAWLLFILLVPYLAIPLFLALGFRKQGSRFARIRFSAVADRRTEATDLRIERDFIHFGVPAATRGNRLDVLANGQDAWRALIELVEGAEISIEATFYLIGDDAVGKAFVAALEKRARAGVEVRLIVDRLGNLFPPLAALRAFQAAGGKLRYFSPILHAPDKGHLNLRNHRKLVVVDRKRAFSGGMNVAGEYMGPDPSPERWVDLSFRIDGPAVRTFIDLHVSDWQAAGDGPRDDLPTPPLAAAGTCVAQLVPSGPDMPRDALHDILVNAIHRAERRIRIVTPYFLPTDMLGHALSVAARRGVETTIIVPARSNHRIADFARGAYLRELASAGCRIRFFPHGMVHAKTGLIDDATFVGSANLDVRSMLLNFEASLFVYDPESVGVIAGWIEELNGRCVPATLHRGLPRRLIEGVFRLSSPVL